MSGGLSCPECGALQSGVTDSRPCDKPLNNVRRRRRCENGHRFTTVEIIADTRFGSLLDVSELPDHLRKPFRALYAAFKREGALNG